MATVILFAHNCVSRWFGLGWVLLPVLTDFWVDAVEGTWGD